MSGAKHYKDDDPMPDEGGLIAWQEDQIWMLKAKDRAALWCFGRDAVEEGFQVWLDHGGPDPDGEPHYPEVPCDE
jgi:hypothetical protein